MVSVQITGLAQLEKKMISLGPKIALKALRGALVSGAREIKNDAINRAPSLSGRLRRAILIKRMPKGNPFNERVIIGVRHGKKLQKTDRDAWYWGFVEFGTKERRWKSGKSTGTMPKQSFIQPAFETKKEKAVDRIKSFLQNKISQFVREPA
jgi:HK97 gp10 family phage protein